jgi:diguanylate cyclase (GGDEF)-like protein/PAS domain S-box-containing protein
MAFVLPAEEDPSNPGPVVRVPQALLALLERTTSDLITLPSAALDELIQRTLADIGGLFDVDRAYLFLARADGFTFDNTHEWCAAGVEPQREHLQGLPSDLLPWWAGEMVAGRPVVLGSLDDLPPEAAAERAFLEPQGIRSLLALPLRWRGHFWGLAGFDHVRCARRWTSDEVTVLGLLASAFAQGFERRRLDERLGLARTVFEEAQEGIFVVDPGRRILDVNPTFSDITGWRADAAIGRLQHEVLPGSDGDEVRRAVQQAGLWRGELELVRPDGQRRFLRCTISPVRGAGGDGAGLVGVFSDITQLREHELKLRQLAYHDPLTQLPNRVLLADRMRQALAQSRRTGEVLAVALLDLDGFKPINDTHGHAGGDRVLVELARRLTHTLRDGDTVARLGGDEFVLLLPGLPSAEEAERLMQRVLAAVQAPIFLDARHVLNLTASVGLRTVPPAPEEADTLLRQADQALYAAKREGRARVRCFDADDEQQALDRLTRIGEVARALERGEMVLHYQPVVDLGSGRVLRAEALVRWARPGRGLVPPGEWLPLIEHTPVIAQLGDWVLATALQACARWQSVQPGVGVSVNASARELCDAGYAQRVAAALARQPTLAPSCLQLEVVESAPMSALPAALATMTACGTLGVGFALDDFGTGYSSLAYLKSLPAEVVKIDRSFISPLGDSESDRRVVQGIVALVDGCGKKVVAEGVETLQQAEILLASGCNVGQGYGILPPVPEDRWLHWLQQPPRPMPAHGRQHLWLQSNRA